MARSAPEKLVHALARLTEDGLFAVTASARFDVEILRALAQRRSASSAVMEKSPQAPASFASRFSGAALADWDSWIVSLSSAMAPIAPPRWLPMNEVVEMLSLEAGARGVRSFFTTKPSEKEVQRVRTLGGLAVRSLASVLGAVGAFPPDAELLRRTLIVAFGLPIEDAQALDQEAPIAAEALDIHGGVEPKIARAIVRGAFAAAMGDGVDPREEQAVVAIARKSGCTSDEVQAARVEAKKHLDATRDLGLAGVDAVRYLLGDDTEDCELLAVTTARLALPIVHRGEALAAINLGAPVTLAKKHALDRKQRAAALALAWLAAMRSDPSITRRAELAARHDLVAADLGAEDDGIAVRVEIDRYLELELSRATEPAPAPV